MLSQGSLEMHMKRHIYLIMRGSSGKIRDPNSSRAQPRYLDYQLLQPRGSAQRRTNFCDPFSREPMLCTQVVQHEKY